MGGVAAPGPGGPAPRGPEPGLSSSEIITLLLVLHSSGFKHLKSFYHGGRGEPLLRGYFPFKAVLTSTSSPCTRAFLCRSVFFLHSDRGTRTGLY